MTISNQAVPFGKCRNGASATLNLICKRLCIVVFLLQPALTLPAQSPPASYNEIDGAKTPYLIPDIIAYRFVMLSLTLPDAPSKTDLFKQEVLQRIALSDNDKAALKDVMSRFAEEYRAWAANTSANPASRRDGIVLGHLALLENQLSTDGFNAFRDYVMGEKSKIRIPK